MSKQYFACGQDLYAAVYDADFHGWWVWRVCPGSQEYFSTLASCTCPAEKPCKHMLGIALLSAPAPASAPAKPSRKRNMTRGGHR